MAYIPPHKRHSKDSEVPSPTPDLLVPQLKKNLNVGSHHSGAAKRIGKHTLPVGKFTYANRATSKWFAVGSVYDDLFPSTIRLQTYNMESVQHKMGQKPAILVNSDLDAESTATEKKISPAVTIAERVHKVLLSSFENVRNEMLCQNLEEVRPTLVARFGKILFHGSPSVSLETASKSPVNESTLRELKRSFYTNLPTCMENIIGRVVPKIGVDFEEEKDIYHVKLSDKMRPDATISCKCCIRGKDSGLELYKIELNQVRHMVIDISCLDKNLDLRLMLCTKRIVTSLTDDEKNSIRALIDSAILDPDVKGGMRWPFGKASSGDRYSVVGVWHTIAKSYKNSSIRLKVRNADRFDFRTSTGEATTEINLKLKGIVLELQKQVDVDLVSDMLKDSLELIWDNFLSCDHSFT